MSGKESIKGHRDVEAFIKTTFTKGGIVHIGPSSVCTNFDPVLKYP